MPSLLIATVRADAASYQFWYRFIQGSPTLAVAESDTCNCSSEQSVQAVSLMNTDCRTSPMLVHSLEAFGPPLICVPVGVTEEVAPAAPHRPTADPSVRHR